MRQRSRAVRERRRAARPSTGFRRALARGAWLREQIRVEHAQQHVVEQAQLGVELADFAKQVEQVADLLARPLLQRGQRELEHGQARARPTPGGLRASAGTELARAAPSWLLDERQLALARILVRREREAEHEQQARIARAGGVIDLLGQCVAQRAADLGSPDPARTLEGIGARCGGRQRFGKRSRVAHGAVAALGGRG